MNYLHTDSLKTIKLYGKLGKLFGKLHKFQVESCAEAIRALCAMVPGFERHMFSDGTGYICYAGNTSLGERELHRTLAKDADIRIVPVVTGSKRNGIGQIIIGAIIVVAAVYTGGAAGAAAGAGGGAAGGGAAAVGAAGSYAGGASVAMGGGAAAGGFMGVTGAYAVAAQLGVSMMLGGVVQAISPQQKSLSTKDGPDNGASYNYNGPVNTTAQGNVIPVGYGRLRVGSAVISAGIYTEDQA